MSVRLRSALVLLLAPVTFLLAACANEDNSAAESDPTSSVTVSATGQPLAWIEPDSYSYVLESRCGERDLIGTFAVTVQDGQVEEVSALDDDAEAMLATSGSEPVMTIGEMVNELETATQNGADRVYLEVDTDGGHPTLIEIDYDTNAVDDESCYTVTDYAG